MLFIISIISKENAEKVVNDPKTPIMRKYLITFEEIFLFSIKPIKYPIKNDPTIFTIKVPMGKFGNIYFIEFVANSLNVAPKAPPTATQKILNNLFY